MRPIVIRHKKLAGRHLTGFVLLAAGALLIVTGCMAWSERWNIFIYLLRYAGFVWMGSGIFLMAHAFTYSSRDNEGKWLAAESVVDLLFGALITFNPFLAAIAFPLIAGSWMLIRGALKVTIAFVVRPLLDGRKTILSIGIISIISGLLILFHSFEKNDGSIAVMSGFAILLGCYYLYDALRFWKRESNLLAML